MRCILSETGPQTHSHYCCQIQAQSWPVSQLAMTMVADVAPGGQWVGRELLASCGSDDDPIEDNELLLLTECSCCG